MKSEMRFLFAASIASELWPFCIGGGIILAIVFGSFLIGCIASFILYLIILFLGWLLFE